MKIKLLQKIYSMGIYMGISKSYYSNRFKDDFKKKVLGKKKLVTDSLESQKDLIQRRIDRTTTELGLLHESISQINVDKALGKRSSSLCDQMMSDLEKELIKKEDDRSNSVQEIKDLDNMTDWVNWVEMYGEDITNKLSNDIQTKEMVENLIDKITVTEVIGEDRDGKHIQIGHRFEILFKVAIVKDKMIYHDENNKPMGYDIKSGRKLLKTNTFKNFTRNGVNRVGYKRKKKTKKTQKVQHAEDDNHPVHTKTFGNSGMSSLG